MANVETVSTLARSRDCSNSSTDKELEIEMANSEHSSESTDAEKGVEICQVGNAACGIPLELFDLPDLKSILSLDVWKRLLTEEEQQSLMTFLPHIDDETFGKTLEELLGGANFHFGCPLSDFLEQLKSGFCRPRVARYREQLKFLQRQKHYHSVKEYHNQMVNVFVEMQKLWEDFPAAEIDERIEIWKSRKPSSTKAEADQTHTDEILEDLERDGCIAESPKRVELSDSKMTEIKHVSAGKRPKINTKRVGPNGQSKHRVDQVQQDIKRSSRPGPKGLLKVIDPKLRLSGRHYPKLSATRLETSPSSSEQAVDILVGEPDRWSSVSRRERTMRRKRGGTTKLELSPRDGKYKRGRSYRNKAAFQCQENKVFHRKKPTKVFGKSGDDPKEENSRPCRWKRLDNICDSNHRNKSAVTELEKNSLQQYMIPPHGVDSLMVENRGYKQGNKIQDFAGEAVFKMKKRRSKKGKDKNLQLKVGNQEKRPGAAMGGLPDRVLEDRLGEKLEHGVQSFEKQKQLDLMNNFLERSELEEERQPREGESNFDRKSSRDEMDGVSFRKNVKEKKEDTFLEGYLENNSVLEENVSRKPSHNLSGKYARPSKIFKSNKRQRPKVQNLDMLSLSVEISPPVQSLSEKEALGSAVKSFGNIVPAVTQSSASAFSFSVSHLLSAVRLALIGDSVERSSDLHQGEHIRGKVNEVKSEIPTPDIKHEQLALNSSSEGNSITSLKQQKTDCCLHDRDEGVLTVFRCPPLQFLEIIRRVQDNPGNSRLRNNQEVLQDLVRGALKVFSSKIAPAGAKSWKPLASYDKETRSWTWIGPAPGVTPKDPWQKQILPEAWGVPQKMLEKMEETFAIWFKHGQETLQQILKFPLPPPPPMPMVLDEKERFRELRMQKSLMTIPTSSEDARAYFRMEELVRYSIPDRAFPYTAADGRKSIVAPLRICGIKLTSKARDHFMLKPDRPPHVTILCLVRDAAARLPQSIGTRADVCALIRDSQFIKEDVSDIQVNQVVSGALDRLHYERDPCVRFDGERKLWMYLHSDRQEEDFEDDGTSSTKRWKKPRKDVSNNGGLVHSRCENGSSSLLDKDLSVNGVNLELNSPEGFDIGETSAIYSAGSAELVYSKSSTLSSPRVFGSGVNMSLADNEELPLIELPPSLNRGDVDYINGHTTSWNMMRRHGLPWQNVHQFRSDQHLVQDFQIASKTPQSAGLDSPTE